jgi:hypothetical protein
MKLRRSGVVRNPRSSPSFPEMRESTACLNVAHSNAIDALKEETI